MQAARRVLQSAGILSRRGMTTAAQLAADAGKPKGSIVDTIGVYTVTPLAVGVFVYDMFIAHEVSAVAVVMVVMAAAAGSLQHRQRHDQVYCSRALKQRKQTSRVQQQSALPLRSQPLPHPRVVSLLVLPPAPPTGRVRGRNPSLPLHAPPHQGDLPLGHGSRPV